MSYPTSSILGGTRGHTQFLFGSHQHQATAPLFIVTVIITMVLAFAIAMTWGLSMLIGLAFLVYAGLIIILGRAKPEVMIIMVAIGLVFIFMNYLGITFTTVDFSDFGIAQKIFSIFH